MPGLRGTPLQRFWRMVDLDETGCWIWTGRVNPKGYGQFRPGGRGTSVAQAHRWAFELFVGSIPDGLHIDHLCRVKACVNPRHLEPVTDLENKRRAAEARRREAAA